MLESRLELHLFGRVFAIGIWVLTSIAVLIPIATLVFLATASDSDNYWDEYYKRYGSNSGKGSKYRLNHEMRDDLFYPDIRSLWIPLPNIKDYLLFLEYNDRPDATLEKSSILLGIKGNEQERFVREGERVYFTCLDRDTIAFSETPTPFWAETSLNRDGGLEVTLKARYLDSEGKDEVFNSTSGFTIKERRKKTFSEIGDVPLKKIAKHLVEAKCFVPDQLFSLYGGKTYVDMQGQYRLVIPHEDGMSHHFVSSGDLLVLEDGKWVVSKRDTKGKPIVLINSIQGHSCEVTLWCDKGISSIQLTLPVEIGEPAMSPIHEVLSKVYKRTENSIMCQLGGKSVIIRKGDWLVKRDGKWRNLRSSRELKDFLGYAFKGELFIFDGIEVRDGVHYCIGHYFNEERTHVVKVDLKLSEKIRKEKKVHTKKKLNPRLVPKFDEGAS